MVLVAALIVLLSFLLPAVASSRAGSSRLTCLNNTRRIMKAMQLYSAEHSDYLPFPGWGQGTGKDCWAYAEINHGRIPGLAFNATIPWAGNQPNGTNQEPFMRIGQLWPFLQDDEVFLCPQDVESRRRPGKFVYRDLKITSYTMSGASSGYGAVNVFGGTYKTSQFQGSDIVFWEPNESQPFYFNDGASQPTETSTQRHGENAAKSFSSVAGSGGSNLGRIDGGAEFMENADFQSLAARRPSRLWCGPSQHP